MELSLGLLFCSNKMILVQPGVCLELKLTSQEWNVTCPSKLEQDSLELMANRHAPCGKSWRLPLTSGILGSGIWWDQERAPGCPAMLGPEGPYLYLAHIWRPVHTFVPWSASGVLWDKLQALPEFTSHFLCRWVWYPPKHEVGSYFQQLNPFFSWDHPCNCRMSSPGPGACARRPSPFTFAGLYLKTPGAPCTPSIQDTSSDASSEPVWRVWGSSVVSAHPSPRE